MRVSWQVLLFSALGATPFPVLVALHARGPQELDAFDRDFLIRNVLYVLVALVVLVAAGRVLFFRTGVGAPALSITSTAIVCVSIAFALAAPVEMTWSDGCNEFSGIAPLISAATYEIGLAESPSSFIGIGTLILCA